MVIAAASAAPRGESMHAIGAHVAEGHGRVRIISPNESTAPTFNVRL